MMRLVGQHPLFRPPAAPPLLAPDFFNARSFRGNGARSQRLDFIQEQAACDEPVEPLLAGRLALHLQAGRAMEEHHASSGFVDILASVASGTNEGLFQVCLVHPKRRHALRQLALFLGANGERAHARQRNQEVTVQQGKG